MCTHNTFILSILNTPWGESGMKMQCISLTWGKMLFSAVMLLMSKSEVNLHQDGDIGICFVGQLPSLILLQGSLLLSVTNALATYCPGIAIACMSGELVRRLLHPTE